MRPACGSGHRPGQVGCLLRIAPEIRALLADLQQLTRTSTRIQGETLTEIRRSLAIQRETRTHVRSIDNKTGGSAPALVPGASAEVLRAAGQHD